jgi:hypothetical protein
LTAGLALSFDEVSALVAGIPGIHDVVCPLCGPACRASRNRSRPVLRIWMDDPDFATLHCARCGAHGYVRAAGDRTAIHPQHLARLKVEAVARDDDYVERQLGKARWLWQSARPAPGTIVETYLRSRAIVFIPPTTARFLAPTKPEHHPAMICAFGIPDEPEPGLLSISAEAINGVHLTLLRADGRAKADAEPNKIMVGRSMGVPLIMAPMNDLLGLAIAEGIEDALSFHEATGCGAWAAGSASRLPALADAVPDYVDCVTICADGDQAGRHHAYQLAARLRKRGLDANIIETTCREIAA